MELFCILVILTVRPVKNKCLMSSWGKKCCIGYHHSVFIRCAVYYIGRQAEERPRRSDLVGTTPKRLSDSRGCSSLPTPEESRDATVPGGVAHWRPVKPLLKQLPRQFFGRPRDSGDRT